MPLFTSAQYPQLVIMTGEGVVARFDNGACDTSDPAAVTVLRGADGVVEQVTPASVASVESLPAAPRPRGRPRKSA